MVQIHRRIATPLVTDIEIAADDSAEFTIELDQVVPRRLPDLFPGAPVTIAGRWRGRPTGGFIVRGTHSDGRQWVHRVGAVGVAQPAIASIWARGHVRELEDRLASLPPQYGAAAAVADLERRIVEVSLRHGVLCRYTAYVAVDTRVVNKDGRIRRVRSLLSCRQAGRCRPRRVAGIYASRVNIAMTPGIVPSRRGRTRSGAAWETALADSRNTGQVHGTLGATYPNPGADADGVPPPLPERTARGNRRRTALEIARHDASRALDRLLAAERGSAGMPGREWSNHALQELLEGPADQLGFLISQLTAAGVPATDFAPRSRLLADLRRALEPAEACLVHLAELHKRACRVLGQFPCPSPEIRRMSPRPGRASLRSRRHR